MNTLSLRLLREFCWFDLIDLMISTFSVRHSWHLLVSWLYVGAKASIDHLMLKLVPLSLNFQICSERPVPCFSLFLSVCLCVAYLLLKVFEDIPMYVWLDWPACTVAL